MRSLSIYLYFRSICLNYVYIKIILYLITIPPFFFCLVYWFRGVLSAAHWPFVASNCSSKMIYIWLTCTSCWCRFYFISQHDIFSWTRKWYRQCRPICFLLTKLLAFKFNLLVSRTTSKNLDLKWGFRMPIY